MAGSLEFKKKLNQKALRALKRHVAVHATMFSLTTTESIAYLRDQIAKATEEPDTIVSLKALKLQGNAAIAHVRIRTQKSP